MLWTAETVPVPSPADGGYLLMPPLVLAGVLALLRARTSSVPVTLRTDGLTAALAIGSVSAAIVVQSALEVASGDPLGIATSLAYPLTDLILGGVVVGALAGSGWRLDRTWALLGLGILTFWLADSLYLVGIAAGTYVGRELVRRRLVDRAGPHRCGGVAAGAPAQRRAAEGGCAADRHAALVRGNRIGRPRLRLLRLSQRCSRSLLPPRR